MTRRDDEYTAALDQLDRMKADGLVSDNAYMLRRQALLDEAAQPRKSRVVAFAKGVGIGLLVIIAVLLLVRFFNAG